MYDAEGGGTRGSSRSRRSFLTYVCAAATVAFVASLMSEYHIRLVAANEIADEYASLAASDLCSNAAERVASASVNGCAAAFHAEMALSPRVIALLQTLQAFSVCGIEGARCMEAMHRIGALSGTLLMLLVVLVAVTAALFIQKRKIDLVMARSIPLDTAGYPTKVPFYCQQGM